MKSACYLLTVNIFNIRLTKNNLGVIDQDIQHNLSHSKNHAYAQRKIYLPRQNHS
jgi:hypothetical protein